MRGSPAAGAQVRAPRNRLITRAAKRPRLTVPPLPATAQPLGGHRWMGHAPHPCSLRAVPGPCRVGGGWGRGAGHRHHRGGTPTHLSHSAAEVEMNILW